jgi:hypothetical protein
VRKQIGGARSHLRSSPLCPLAPLPPRSWASAARRGTRSC